MRHVYPVAIGVSEKRAESAQENATTCDFGGISEIDLLLKVARRNAQVSC